MATNPPTSCKSFIALPCRDPWHKSHPSHASVPNGTRNRSSRAPWRFRREDVMLWSRGIVASCGEAGWIDLLSKMIFRGWIRWCFYDSKSKAWHWSLMKYTSCSKPSVWGAGLPKAQGYNFTSPHFYMSLGWVDSWEPDSSKKWECWHRKGGSWGYNPEKLRITGAKKCRTKMGMGLGRTTLCQKRDDPFKGMLSLHPNYMVDVGTPFFIWVHLKMGHLKIIESSMPWFHVPFKANMPQLANSPSFRDIWWDIGRSTNPSDHRYDHHKRPRWCPQVLPSFIVVIN